MDKKLKKEIVEYLEKNTPEMDWDYRDSLSKENIEQILSGPDGMMDFENELYEMNLDYIWEIESCFIDNVMEEFNLDMDKDDFREMFLDHIYVNFNIKGLLNNTPDITCLVNVYSNYDCATSMTPFEPYEYTWEVWQRVKKGVLKKDFLSESAEVYGGSLFCFVFKTSLENLIELKQGFKNSITIPKGTQFGFFSSFVGSGSIFEHVTTKNMTLPATEPDQTEYDSIGIIADFEQSYSMGDVYGGSEFVDHQNVSVN